MLEKQSIDIYKIWIGLAAFVVIVAGMKAASSIIVLFLISVFIATVSAPALFWLERLKIPRFIAFLIVLSIVVVVLFGFGYILSSSVDSFLSNMPIYQAKIIELIDLMSDYLNLSGVDISKPHLKSMLDPGSILSFATLFLKSFTAILSKSFIIFLGATFMLFEISSFQTKVALLSQNSTKGESLLNSFSNKLNHYLAIKTIISFITGLLIALGLFFLGIDFAFLLGLIAFLLNYIPSFGSILAAVPAILVALVGNDLGDVFWVISIYLAVNIVMGNIIDPRLMGKSLGLSVVVVFFSLIFWGWVLGPVGMFLAVPLSMTIKIALDTHPSTRPIAMLLSSVDKK
ncbi:MAG: AI-2E family transporter [Sulfurovum sp.]|nr:AI-2E family transporter [Sulfurovum sp.]